MKHSTHNTRAFTLLEMSIVLVVLALIAAMALTLWTANTRQEKAAKIEADFTAIENALEAFQMVNDRLPCPANTAPMPDDPLYGYEAPTPGTCVGSLGAGNVSYGVLPTKTLGLPDSAMLDAWGRRITYMVDTRATQTGSFSDYQYDDTNIGSITVRDAAGNNRTIHAILTLISHGANGHGAFTRTGGTRFDGGSTNLDEQENCDCDTTGTADASKLLNVVVQRDFSQTPGNSRGDFDDYVIYKMRFHYPDEAESAEVDGDTDKDIPDIFVGEFDRIGMFSINPLTRTVSKFDVPDITPPPGPIFGMDISHDNRFITAFACGDLRLFKLKETHLEELSIDPIATCASNVAFSKGRSSYIAILDGVKTHVYKRNGNHAKELFNSNTFSPDVGFSPDNQYIAVANDALSPNGATLFKRTGDTFSQLPDNATGGFQPPVAVKSYSLSFSPNGAWLALGQTNNIQIYNAAGGDVFNLVVTQPINGGVSALAFSPNSRYLAAGTATFPYLDLFVVNDDGSLQSTIQKLTKTIVAPPAPPAPADPNISPITYTYPGPIVVMSQADFTGSYADAQGDPLASINVISLPTNGTLLLSGVPVALGATIPAADLNNLSFDAGVWTGSTSFSWSASDGANLSLPNAVIFNITGAGAPSKTITPPPMPTANNPAINPISITGPGPVISFSATDFTSAYTDAEGDPLNSIRIESWPTSGTLSWTPPPLVALNTPIPVANLGSLKFVAPPNWLGTVFFDWSAHDGSNWSTPKTVTVTTNFVAPGDTINALSFTRDGRYLAVSNASPESFNTYLLQADELHKIIFNDVPGYSNTVFTKK